MQTTRFAVIRVLFWSWLWSIGYFVLRTGSNILLTELAQASDREELHCTPYLC